MGSPKPTAAHVAEPRYVQGRAALKAFSGPPRTHVVAFTGGTTSQTLLAAWLSWQASMVSSDPEHAYELHHVSEPNMRDSPGTGRFQDELWFRASIRKVHVLLEIASRLPNGTAIVQTDLDVVPIRPYSRLPVPPRGMSFGIEGESSMGLCNTGFYAFRVSGETLGMLRRWVNASGPRFWPFADQSALAKLKMCNASLRFPRALVSGGEHGDIGAETVAFHANGPRGWDNKRALLRTIVARSTLRLQPLP